MIKPNVTGGLHGWTGTPSRTSDGGAAPLDPPPNTPLPGQARPEAARTRADARRGGGSGQLMSLLLLKIEPSTVSTAAYPMRIRAQTHQVK